MIVTLPVSTPPKPQRSNGKKSCSCAQSAQSLLSPPLNNQQNAIAGILRAPINSAGPVRTQVVRTKRPARTGLTARGGKMLAVPAGSNLFRRAPVSKKAASINRKSQITNLKSRMRRTGLGDDVDAILDLTYPPPPPDSSSIVVGGMPSSSQILAATGLSPTDTSAFSLNNLLAGSLVLAGTPPGVTPSEYASTITQSTGIPVSPGPTPYVPAPSTVAGANPNLLQTSGVPPAQQQTFSQWLNTKNASIGGLPNWAILAGLGIFGTVIIAGAKKRR